MVDLEAVRRRIDSDRELTAIRDEAERRLGDDAGHDLGHLLRVAAWTLELGDEGVDPRAAIAAALLHDLVNLPKNSPERARASGLSADQARELLDRLGFPRTTTDEVAQAIRDHSFSRGSVPRSPLGRALQDADRLDALGALGIFRALATGVRLGAQLFDEDDPWAERRSLDDRRFTVDHFFTKLLELPPTLQTAAGRREAERRVGIMHRYLLALGEEIGHPLQHPPR